MTEYESQSTEVNYNLSGTPCLNVKLLPINESKQEPQYSILNYNKELLSYHKENILLYRSVVFSYPELSLLSFSPPKIETPYTFFSKENVDSRPSYYVNEYIDGLLIHLFYDTRFGKWVFTTHNNMIVPYDETRKNSLSSILCKLLKYDSCKDASKLPFWENFSKEHCYNFTLTNKYSHTYSDRRLYLTSVYKINGKRVIPVSPEIYEKWNMFDVLHGLIHFPENYNRLFQETSYIQDDIKEKNISGLMVMNTRDGSRCKYISESYNIYKRLRHIEPYYLYIYICYAKMNKHNKMLPFIYKSRYNMKKIHSIWKLFVHYLHQTYLDYYVFKKDIYFRSEQLFSYLEQIHVNQYIRQNKNAGLTKVNKKDVFTFLINKHPQDVFHLLRNI